MATILVTGSNGQLGSEIQQLAPRYPDHQFIFTDVAELDICDVAALEEFFSENHVDCLINCAAYTAVDRAEDETELAYKINEKAVRLLGEAAALFGIRMIHVSTDYVFDGKTWLPYNEDAKVNPATAYGKTKLAGELGLQKVCPDAVIVRTSWLYSSFGNNFVKTMLKLGRERDRLTVIFDQVCTPTYAADLAEALLQIATTETFVPGIYHYSNEGVCSWYDFTVAIHRIAGVDCEVVPIQSKDYPTRTPRPFYSVLNKHKIKSVYNIKIAHWEASLKRCLFILENS